MRYEWSVTRLEIVDVNASNVDEKGLFCAMSKRDSEGYRQKLSWAKARFSEGLRIKIVEKGGRGFIEYMPAEVCWRPIDAPGYMAIHCLWVVGRAKSSGCGTSLLFACIEEARSEGMSGVVAVTARKKTGFCETDFFLKRGFQLIERDPCGLDLVALKLANVPDPKFSADWARKAGRIGDGLCVSYSAQCPFAADLVENLRNVAAAHSLPVAVRKIEAADQIRRECPSGYGTFTVTYDHKVITHLYHRLTPEKLVQLIDEHS